MVQKAAEVVNDLCPSLDVETRVVVQQHTREIKTLMRRTAQDVVDIGQSGIDRAQLDETHNTRRCGQTGPSIAPVTAFGNRKL